MLIAGTFTGRIGLEEVFESCHKILFHFRFLLGRWRFMGELKYFQLSKTTFDTNLAFYPTFFTVFVFCFFLSCFLGASQKKKDKSKFSKNDKIM